MATSLLSAAFLVFGELAFNALLHVRPPTMAETIMKLSDEDYENLYEAALLDYGKALDALVVAKKDDDDEVSTNDTRDSRRQRNAELHSRLIVAGAERLGILALCASEPSSSSSSSSSSSAFAMGLLHKDERTLSRDAAAHSRSFQEAFVVKQPPSAVVRPPRNGNSNMDAVDMDAFFRDYPHAKKRDDEYEEYDEDYHDDDNDDDDGESAGSDVQCLGVKRPAQEAQRQPTLLQDMTTASVGDPSSNGPRPMHQHFQYTPQEPPAAWPDHLEADTAAARFSSSIRPPPPPTTLTASTTTTMPPPPPPSEASWATRQQAWDDHHHQSHAQNPFQTAREYAQAGGGGTNGDAAAHADASHQATSSAAPAVSVRPSMGPPYTVGYNPYLKSNPPPNAAPEPSAPEPPLIRDSLRRKFQPPKLGGTGLQNQPPRGRAPSGGALVKQALGAGGGQRPGSSSGRTNGANANSSTAGGGEGGDGDDNDLPEELQRYGKDLVDKILGEIMDSGDPVTFAEIAGLDDVKQTVQEVVCWPMKRPDLFTGLRKAPNGLLLFGPPGTGKTLIGKAIAHESGATFFSISSSSLTSKWIGEGEKLVRTLFAVAAYREPAVVFIDEIDSLLTQRKADENEASRRIKTEFLVQLDGTGTSGQGRVLVVGATNRPQELDDAARRRFVKRLYIPLPEEADRECLLRVLLEKNKHQITDEEVKKLAKDTAGFSGADLKSLSTEAAMGPMRQLGPTMLAMDEKDIPPIVYKHFRMALRRTKPSVAPADLVQYETFDTTYGFRNALNDESLDDDDDDDDETP